MFDTQAFAGLVAFAATLLLLAIFLWTGLFIKIQDIPNQRSLHTQPTPRIGGIALMIGAVGTHTMIAPQPLWRILFPALLLIGISLADDILDLPVRWRFLAHAVAAVTFVGWGQANFSIDIVAVVAVFAIIWMTNLYNFMDGSDGLAGGMAVVGFTAYGVAALQNHHGDLANVSFCLAASAIAFLLYNFHPAKVFLGDVGSIPLGFAASSIGLIGWNRGTWPLWFPILAFSPFIVDASVTLLNRMIRGDKITQAHKVHYYQRLIRMGWGHRRTALSEYVLMACAGISAIAGLRWTQSMQLILLIAWTLAYLALTFLIDRAWQRYQAVEHPTI